MIPNLTWRSRPASRSLTVLAPLTLGLGLLAALMVAELTMSPPSSELLTLAAYLSLSAGVVYGLGLVLARVASRGRFGLRTQAFGGSVIGGIVALANTFVIARLMFVSTSHDLWVLAAAISFSAGVAALFSLAVAASAATRLDLIDGAVRSLAGEDMAAEASQESIDEVARLATAVQRLSARLQTAEAERRRVDAERRELTAAVSHDLRTPVANVRAIAEALSAGVLEDTEDQRRYLNLILREVERLGRLIDDLFDLAQLDAGALRLERRPLPLEEIAADVVEGMRPAAQQKGVALTFGAPPSVLPQLLLDGARIERVVANLLRNAIEHTPAGGRVGVRIDREGDWLSLTVSDSGEGFDASHREEIWQRFYRVDKARSRQPSTGDGSGLGLSIVRGFVEAHGGRVSATSTPGEGSVFTIRLPSGEDLTRGALPRP